MSRVNSSNYEPVAIVGMGCQWPGGVRDCASFWEFLSQKVNGWKKFEDPRFSAQGFHHPNPERPGGFSMEGAFLVDDDARLFDHSFFGITGVEAETMDPLQRKLLEVAYEAIENAGDTWESISGSRTGVFVGSFCLDHWTIQTRDWDNPRPYAFTGAGTSILANRISYVFNLQGPSLAVDTACSSSMYALHLAVNAIRNGECDSAIVAAGNWIADPGIQIALDKLGALSSSSRCHTFDARADGYARGEGYGAIYLKRPSLAISACSPIRAMIRGTAVNSNGRTGGITRPSANGQEAVIREAYRHAGDLAFADTSYFECHGTGTYVGDPIEVAAVGRVFASERTADNPLRIGSVKSNLGHGEGASALAAVMKVILCLERGEIAPVYDLQTRNPNIDFETANVLPVTEITPWPEGQLKRASINSFGYGGANSHCIIDHVSNVLPSYLGPGVYQDSTSRVDKPLKENGVGPSQGQELLNLNYVSPKMKSAKNASTRPFVLLPLSAHNESSLMANLGSLNGMVNERCLADVAYTLGARRSRYAERSYCIVSDQEDREDLSLSGPIVRSSFRPIKIAFIFTGQGAQWHSMGSQLLVCGTFRRTIRYLDLVLGELPEPPPWSLESIISGKVDPELIENAQVSQAACTAVQIGLVNLLASWSVRPSGVVGHSSGEIAAAYASGYLSAKQALKVAYFRGQAVSGSQTAGTMLAVGLEYEKLAPYMEDLHNKVKIAAINSPRSVTLSGDEDAIKIVSEALERDGVFNRKLNTGGMAYHSHHMLPAGRRYEDSLDEDARHTSKLDQTVRRQVFDDIRWVSSVHPSKSPKGLDLGSSYWRSNLESPVLFSQAVEQLLTTGETIDALVEIGPHSALKAPLEQIVKATGQQVKYIPSLKRREHDFESILHMAGALFSLNAKIDLAAVNAIDDPEGQGLVHGCVCAALPPYKYTYGSINYHESRLSTEYRYRSVLKHDLLGSKVAGTARYRPQWRNILRLKDVPWLADHKVASDIVFPGAAYLAMAVEAATQTHDTLGQPRKIEDFTFRDVEIKRALKIPETDRGVELVTTIGVNFRWSEEPLGWLEFTISSVKTSGESEWAEHCVGYIRTELETCQEQKQLPKRAQVSRPVDAKAWYRKFQDIGLDYGPAFQPLSDIRAKGEENTFESVVRLETTAGDGRESSYPLHPASLDGAIQLGLIACHQGRPTRAHHAYVPVRIPWMRLSNKMQDKFVTGIASGEKRGMRSAHIDVQMVDEQGEVVLDIHGLRCVAISGGSHKTETGLSSPFTRLVWKPDIRMLRTNQARVLHPPPDANVEKVPSWTVMTKLAQFVVFSMYEAFSKISGGYCPSGEVGHFFSWIQRKGKYDHSASMTEARELAKVNLLLEAIDDLVKQAPEVVEVKIAKLIHDNAIDILYERKAGIDILIDHNLLTSLYEEGLLMTAIYPQLSHVLSGLAHANPDQRVLELGAGTGGATRIALKAFDYGNGTKAYRDYTFTDISPGFLSSARNSFSDKELRDMKFSVLDLEVDPVEQGYEDEAYDLIIACQVLHATSSLAKTLYHCHKLLKPGGKLLMVESTDNLDVLGVVVGTFSGYWAGVEDGRIDSAFQSLPAWDKSLRESGFSGLDLVLEDFPQPQSTSSVILSTALPQADRPPEHVDVHMVYVLSGESTPEYLVDALLSRLHSRGLDINTLSLAGETPEFSAGAHIIALFDDTYNLCRVEQTVLDRLQHIARNAATLISVTSYGTAGGKDPTGALHAGLLRVLQNENPSSQYISVDIDAANFNVAEDELSEFCRSIVEIHLNFEKNRRGLSSGSEVHKHDREFSWQDGCIRVSRHVPDNGTLSRDGLGGIAKSTEEVPLGDQGNLKADFETPGVFSSLYFRSCEEVLEPLPPHCIDVAVKAIGVNDWDFDTWNDRRDGKWLSTEFAGIVVAVGANVGQLAIGDRVFGLGKGQLGNHIRVPAAWAKKFESTKSFVDMASIPLAYSVATYISDHIVDLGAGRSVLVQSGASDVGLAILSLALRKDAVVSATVESDEQADILTTNMLIPAARVIKSSPKARIPVADLRRAAGDADEHKGGFDVIVGDIENHDEGVFGQILAPRGHLVDLVRNGRVESDKVTPRSSQALPRNTTRTLVDFFECLESDPTVIGDILEGVDQYRRQGFIDPIQKITTVNIADAASNTDRLPDIIGKLVISFEEPSSLIKVMPSAPVARFDPEASYIITGGFGGVGRSLALWMIKRGVRHLAILSRRTVEDIPGAAEFLESLSSRGISVQSFTCDISTAAQVTETLRQICSLRSVKGIVHAAGSYVDFSFDKLTPSDWNRGISAKVDGTKNLHEATLSLNLDFFVMTTSALSLYAFPTQSSYTAANNFQDAFARHRRSLGLPASTVSLGLIEEVTDVGVDTNTQKLFDRNKAMKIDEDLFLKLFEPAFLGNRTSHHAGSGQWVGQLEDPHSEANLHTYLDPKTVGDLFEGQSDGQDTSLISGRPAWLDDARASLMLRALTDSKRMSSPSGPENSQQSGSKSGSELYAQFKESVAKGSAARAETVTLVQTAIVNAVAQMLFVEADTIDPGKSVADLGVDSLIAAELRNWFLQGLGYNISMLDLLDPSTSISAWAGSITDGAGEGGQNGIAS